MEAEATRRATSKVGVEENLRNGDSGCRERSHGRSDGFGGEYSQVD
jgi:hypothetical protein